ncbi:MAG: AhpC/TSA family protein [Chitinophagaceae bacterium]|nr:AhpC/TSA family protein [Chitinophagaceae bacterium]
MQKLILFLLLPVFSYAQPKLNGFEIKGQITGLKDNTQVILKSGNNGKTIATTSAINGAFILTGILTDPDILQLSFSGVKDLTDIFISNEKLLVTGDINAVSAFQFSGSQTESDYQIFKEQLDPYKDKLNKLAAQINTEKDATKRDGLMKEFNDGKLAVVKSATAFMKQKPASAVSPFVLYVVNPLLEGGIVEIESYYSNFAGEAKQGPYAKAIENAINESKLGAVGSMALDFTQKDTNGKPVSLSSFKGKYVLVDFWASWCGPCRQENPNVVNVYNKYKDKNFTVLGISLDQDRSRWLQAIRADNLTWTHLSDLQYWNNEVALLYKIHQIPSNMLIDPTGKIIGKNLRGTELQETLKSLLTK